MGKIEVNTNIRSKNSFLTGPVLKGGVFGKGKDIIAQLAKLFPKELHNGLSYGNLYGSGKNPAPMHFS
jgi:hypothetical protein